MGVTGRLRGAVFAPYADDPRAPACRWGTRGDQRKPPIRRRPSAGGGYERSPSIRATLGAWWRRRRISPFTSCRRCRCGSWRCRSACATSYTAMPIFRAPPCGGVHARGGATLAFAQSGFGPRGPPRRGGLHSPLRLDVQCPPPFSLRRHRRRVRLRRRGQGHLHSRHRAFTTTATSACWRDRPLTGNFRGVCEGPQMADLDSSSQ